MIASPKNQTRINSRAKGCRGEREACELLRSHGIEARRGQQFKGSPDSPDVVSDLTSFHLEIKRTESLSVYSAMEQAVKDSGTDTAVVLHRRNGKPWVAVILAEDLLPILKMESEIRKL